MVEAGGNRTPVRKPPSQSYPVIRSDKAYAESVFLDDLVSLSAKDCYPELAQNRNVFAARGGKGEFVVRSDAMPRWVVLRDFMLVLHQALG